MGTMMLNVLVMLAEITVG